MEILIISCWKVWIVNELTLVPSPVLFVCWEYACLILVTFLGGLHALGAKILERASKYDERERVLFSARSDCGWWTLFARICAVRVWNVPSVACRGKFQVIYSKFRRRNGNLIKISTMCRNLTYKKKTKSRDCLIYAEKMRKNLFFLSRK